MGNENQNSGVDAKSILIMGAIIVVGIMALWGLKSVGKLLQ